MATKKKSGKKTTKKKTSGSATRKKKAGKTLKKGDKVSWSSLNGPSKGKVKKKLTRNTRIKAHAVKASEESPKYLVESDKTGKQAAHSAKSLKKR